VPKESIKCTYLVQQLNYKFCFDFLLSSVICIFSTVGTNKLK